MILNIFIACHISLIGNVNNNKYINSMYFQNQHSIGHFQFYITFAKFKFRAGSNLQNNPFIVRNCPIFIQVMVMVYRQQKK